MKLILNESLISNKDSDIIEDTTVGQQPDYQIIDITVIPDETYYPTIQSILIDLDESGSLKESEDSKLDINILSETVNIKTGYSNSLFEFESSNKTITLSLVLQEMDRRGIYKVEAYTTRGVKVFESNTYKPKMVIESYLNSLANEYLIEKPLKETAKLKEAGEWDDYDEDNIASKNNLTEVAKYIADRVPGGNYDEARGFDAYQGPYAYVSSDITGGELWYGETNELFQLETGYGWILGNKDTLVKALSDKDYLLQLVEEAKKYIDSLNESADIEDGTVYKLTISKDENSGPQTVWRFNTREAAEKEEEFFKSSGLYTRIDEEKITRSREDIQRRIEEIDREIENKVKRYSSAQKQYHGDNALSNRLEGEIDSLSVEKERLQALLNEADDPIKDDVKEDLNIEPGSDEEAMLDEIYDNSIEEDKYYGAEDEPYEDSPERNVMFSDKVSYSTQEFVDSMRLADEVYDLNIDYSNWNDSTREEREELAKPEISRFLDIHKEEFDKNPKLFELLQYNLTDANFHTEAKVMRDLYKGGE